MNRKITDQAEMEIAVKKYFETLTTTQAGQFNAMLNPEPVACSYAEKTLTVALRVEPWMVNPAGILHGGIEASIMDFTMGVLSRLCMDGKLTPTVSMNIEYLRSFQIGDRVLVTAVCEKCGSHLSYISARAWEEKSPEKIALTASATYYTG